ncbi:aa3-type cytochrome c oxidase subunit IV [Yoonia sp.]
MADHEPGKMDITEQEKTFNGFVSLSIKAVVIIVVLLIFLALVGA